MAPNAERKRRRTQRVSTRGEIDFWVGSMHFSGYYTDISTNGIFIETMNPVEPRTRCRMRFTLPGCRGTIEAEGVVIWSEVPMGMGVEFLTLTQDAYTAIKDFSTETQKR